MSDEMELLMPFVVCASNGGPFSDDAFTAGWEMGRLDLLLTMLTSVGQLPAPQTIRRANYPQAELIAMKHHLVMGESGWENPDDETDALDAEWAVVTFDWGLL